MSSGVYIAAGFGLTAAAILTYTASLRSRIISTQASVRDLRTRAAR
jgi:hypothetical protein